MKFIVRPLEFFRFYRFGLPVYWSIHKQIKRNVNGQWLVVAGNGEIEAGYRTLREAKSHVNTSWRQYITGED